MRGDLVIFLAIWGKKIAAKLGIEATTLDLDSQSGAFDLFVTGTPLHPDSGCPI